MTHTSRSRPVCTRSVATLTLALLLVSLSVQGASAASTWNPTSLVNTESFQTLDEGDSTTNIEIRFGQTLNEKLFYDRTNLRFQFSRGIYVGGNITATGSLSIKKGMSGATLRVDGNADVWGALSATGTIKSKSDITINSDNGASDAVLTFGNDSLAETLQFDRTQARFEFSDDLYVENTLEVDGTTQLDGATTINNTLDTTGNITTDGNLTINEDNGNAAAVLTFGNDADTAALTFTNDANPKFSFDDDVRTTGNLSGATLNVDGTLNWRGQAYTAPTSQSAGTFLKTDGAGNLTWSSASVGNGSGNVLAIRPEYPNAVYFSSGSSIVGILNYNTDTTNNQNYYRWTTTKATLQDYWVSVQVQVPKNFSHFESASGMLLRLRTSTTSSADNHISLRLKDTTGANVALTTNASLTSTTSNTWRTVTIGGLTAGTYTPGSDIIVYVKVAATTSGFADLGSINFNWASSTP